MIKSVCPCLSLGLAAMLIAGCQSMNYNIDPAQGSMLGTPSTPSVSVVDQKVTAHYLFWGLMAVSVPDMNDIALMTAGPDRVLAGLTIKEKNSFLNGFLAVISLGIYRPRTIEITGQVYNKEGLSYE